LTLAGSGTLDFANNDLIIRAGTTNFDSNVAGINAGRTRSGIKTTTPDAVLGLTALGSARAVDLAFDTLTIDG
jgi:hypothetical protein